MRWLQPSLRWLGLALLALTFGTAAWRELTRAAPEGLGDSNRVRLTFAHYLVYESNRAFFDEAIEAYQLLHPHVTIEQIDVPPTVLPAWRQTRFTGGTPPDIMQVGRGFNDEQFLLYMRTLRDYVSEPNPYNEGTPLQDLPWKDTFVDGLLVSSESFRPLLHEYYGVTTYQNIVRVFYNRDLYRQITGHDRPPATYEEFIALGEITQAFAQPTSDPRRPRLRTRQSHSRGTQRSGA